MSKKKVDWDEIGMGDYIHVENEMDVIVLSEIVDGKFVGTNGNIVHLFEITEESRLCTDREIDGVDKRMINNGFLWCDECESLIPVLDNGELCEEIEALKKATDDLFETFKNIFGDELAEKAIKKVHEKINEVVESVSKESVNVNELGDTCKDAINKIVNGLKQKELSANESKAVINALKSLVELGKEYE